MSRKKVKLDKTYSTLISKALRVLIDLDDRVQTIVTQEEKEMAKTLRNAIEDKNYREVNLSNDSE